MSDSLSENSVIKSDTSGDINVKYNRLATEYSKLRGQNAVLKKAVLEEQVKNAELNEVLRSKEQTIRKSSQEMEALNFRNSQLTVRISVLQEEIDFLNNKNGKKKSKNTSDTQNGMNNPFLDAEIEKTMIENAKLTSQLISNDEKHQEEINCLKKEISTLNYELDQKNIKMMQILDADKMAMDQLQKELQELKREYATKVVKLKETEVELSTLINVHKSYVEEVGPKLEILMQLLPRKIPFLDEENTILNKLNVKSLVKSDSEKISPSKPVQKCFSALILAFYNIIHNITLELKELGFDELKIYIKSLLKEDDGLQLSEKLNACYQLLENIGGNLSNSRSMEFIVHQFVKSFLDLSRAIDHSYVNGSGKLKPDHLTSNIDDCVTDNIENFNVRKNELVENIITLPNSQHSLIHEEFENLNIAIKNLTSVINDIDQERVQSNARKLNDKYGFIKKSAHYLRSLKKDTTERIPYAEALENKSKLQEYIMINNVLLEEIRNLENTVTSLEREKICLQNEYQVLEKRSNDSDNVTCQGQNELFEITNELGKFTSSCYIPAEILAREKEMLGYVNKKINEIVISKQETLGKARTFMLECKALQRRLENCVVEKQLLENKYLKCNQDLLQLREELSTISQNYEVQLSTMSEHLASVNEKLASQTEEIDNLHYQINNKASRRSKLK